MLAGEIAKPILVQAAGKIVWPAYNKFSMVKERGGRIHFLPSSSLMVKEQGGRIHFLHSSSNYRADIIEIPNEWAGQLLPTHGQAGGAGKIVWPGYNEYSMVKEERGRIDFLRSSSNDRGDIIEIPNVWAGQLLPTALGQAGGADPSRQKVLLICACPEVIRRLRGHKEGGPETLKLFMGFLGKISVKIRIFGPAPEYREMLNR